MDVDLYNAVPRDFHLRFIDPRSSYTVHRCWTTTSSSLVLPLASLSSSSPSASKHRAGPHAPAAMKSIDIADTSMPASMEGDAGMELHRISSRSQGNETPDKILSGASTPASYSDEPSQELRVQPQGRPSDLPTMWSEVALVLLCSSAQLLFASFLGNMIVLQSVLLDKIHIKESQTPWIQGAFTLANGLAVIISGSLADLFPPKKMICAAFAWLVLWNIIGGVSLRIGSAGLFFVVRAMQGAAIGLLVATAISMLGRIYHPGRRKNRAFSAMASTAPLGFWVGTIQ